MLDREVRFQSTHPHGVRRIYSIPGRRDIRVSIHAPTRGATLSYNWIGTRPQVSIHAPTRGATVLYVLHRTIMRVSIHAPTRGATTLPASCQNRISCFNPRTHTGCDTDISFTSLIVKCFNPRTHTGCDYLRPSEIYIGSNVSIHAPTRGATKARCSRDLDHDGFNPRTHTGCDQVPLFDQRGEFGFNPRTHTGCDVEAFVERVSSGLVSIHAPTRGATQAQPSALLLASQFQSTHPHGVRRIEFGRFILRSCFNPRTHTGCDNGNIKGRIIRPVSIHAPTRGATLCSHYLYFLYSVSIHAPTRGATNCVGTPVLQVRRFQSTHPHGVRRWLHCIALFVTGFQSTHPHGVRHTPHNHGRTFLLFQSTHPHGVRHFPVLYLFGFPKVSIHAPTRGATRRR